MSGGGGCSGSKGAPVKIVIINTQYVETDATSFKDVVQKLTGKDSHRHRHLPAAAKREEDHDHDHNHNRNRNHNQNQGAVVEVPAVLMRDVSTFKEFDRLLAQMPPFNDLCSSELY